VSKSTSGKELVRDQEWQKCQHASRYILFLKKVEKDNESNERKRQFSTLCFSELLN